MSTASVRIERRFRGPWESGNGGYSCGLVAQAIDGPAEVTLRAPPPLETDLRLETRDGGTAALLGPDGALVAEGRPTEIELDVPAPVSFEAATAASARYIGLEGHPYPGCFVCGPEAHDGLRLFAGAVAGRNVAAAPWTPAADLGDASGKVRPEVVWASLDCPSWFGHAAFAERVPPILLGRLAASILARPSIGERCVVLGWSLGREGRRVLCASALFGESGDCLAYARATWIELKS